MSSRADSITTHTHWLPLPRNTSPPSPPSEQTRAMMSVVVITGSLSYCASFWFLLISWFQYTGQDTRQYKRVDGCIAARAPKDSAWGDIGPEGPQGEGTGTGCRKQSRIGVFRIPRYTHLYTTHVPLHDTHTHTFTRHTHTHTPLHDTHTHTFTRHTHTHTPLHDTH